MAIHFSLRQTSGARVMERESIEMDVLFVGAGPASLSGALHLSRLVSEHNEAVEKGTRKGRAARRDTDRRHREGRDGRLAHPLGRGDGPEGFAGAYPRLPRAGRAGRVAGQRRLLPLSHEDARHQVAHHAAAAEEPRLLHRLAQQAHGVARREVRGGGRQHLPRVPRRRDALRRGATASSACARATRGSTRRGGARPTSSRAWTSSRR